MAAAIHILALLAVGVVVQSLGAQDNPKTVLEAAKRPLIL